MKRLNLFIVNETKKLISNHILIPFCLVFLVLWIAALNVSMKEYSHETKTRAHFKSLHRKLWEDQFPKNPHMAAHFGTFAFKQANPLSIFDKGISNYSGTFIYLEAHRQNDFLFSPAQNASVFLRMGEFNISFLLQFIIPLFILTIGAGMFSEEKERGIIAFIKANAVPVQYIAYAKILVLTGLVSATVLLLALGSVFICFVNDIHWSFADLSILVVLFSCYTLFYFTLSSLAVLISLKSKTYKTAFVTSCFVWIILFFLIPRLSINLANSWFPLPSNIAFREQVKKNIDQGINGHARGDREKHVIDSLLQAHGVDSTHKLPVNIDGILLAQGEQYSSNIYTIHFQKLNQRLISQQQISQVAGLFDPFLPMRNLSMQLCKNNIQHEKDFREQAEKYRNYFVNELNNNMTLYSKESEFNTYKVDSEVYRKIYDFNYQPPTSYQTLHGSLSDIMLLFIFMLCLQGYLLIQD